MLIRAIVWLALASALVLVWTAPVAAAGEPITEQTIAEQGADYELRLAYPQLGLPGPDAAMQEWVHALAADFRDVAAERRPPEPPYSARLEYDVARNDDAVVSILFSYSLYTGGAHPNLIQAAFNFLLPDGVRVFLPDLVGDEGLRRVSDLAIADLTAQLAGPDSMSDTEWIRTGAGPYAENFETFELLADELVLEFDPYAVAAYAAGPQHVRIPLAQLQDVLRADPRVPLPSFDCAAARTAVELAICADMPLAQLDRRTAEAFNARLRLEALGTRPLTVRAQQQAWLATRDAACATMGSSTDLVTCLRQQYAARLSALQRFD